MADEIFDAYGVKIEADASGYIKSIDNAVYKTKVFQQQQDYLKTKLAENQAQQKKTADAIREAAKQYGDASDEVKSLSEKLDKLKKQEQILQSDLTRVNSALSQQNTALRETGSAAQQAGNSIEQVGNKVSSLSRIIGTILTAQAGKGFLEATIGSLSEFEQYEASFAVMLGDMDKAKTLMEELREFAAATPLAMTDLTGPAQTLLQFGVAAEDLLPTLKMLGDVSLGNRDRFNSLALAFGQISSIGRLMGQDLLQLINAGFNPLQVMAEQTGKSVADLKKEMEDGAISADMVKEAFQTATAEGGQFFNALEEQSQTLAGQWSTLKDNIGETFRDIGEGAFDETKKALANVSNELERLKKSGELGQIADKWGAAFRRITEAAMGATTWIIKNKEAVGAMISAYGALKVVQQATVMVKAYQAAVQTSTATQAAFNTVASANPYMLLVSALTMAVGAMVAFSAAAGDATSALKQQREELENAREQLEEYGNMDFSSANEELANLVYLQESVIPKIEELGANTERTAGQTELLKKYIAQVNEALGEEAITFDNLSGSISYNTEQLQSNMDALIKRAEAEAVYEKLQELQKDRVEWTMKQMEYQNQLNALLAKEAEIQEAIEESRRSGEFDELTVANVYERFWKPLSEVEAQITQVNGLIADSTILIDGYDQQIDQWGESFGDLFKEIGEDAENSDESVATATQTFGEYINAVKSAQEQTKILADAESEAETYGRLTAGTLEKLAQNYSELTPLIDNYLLGLIDVQDLIQAFGPLYDADERNHKSYLEAKAAQSTGYYQAMVLNDSKLLKQFADNYGVDLTNFKTLAEAKAQVEAQLISSLAEGWQRYYHNVGNSASKTVEAMEAQLRTIQTQSHASMDESSKKQIAYLQETIKKFKALEDLQNITIDIDAGSILSDFEKAAIDSATKSASKTASKSTAKTAAKTWQDEYYAELQHLRKMDQISEEEYLSGLTKLRDSYRETDIAKYRKYDEEIYSIQKKSADALKKQSEEMEKIVEQSFQKQLSLARDYLAQQRQQITDEYEAAAAAINDRYDRRAEAAKADYEAEKKRVDGIIEQIDREIKARQKAREEEKLDDQITLAQKKVQSLQTRITYARTPEERAELEKELKRQQEELKDLVNEKEIAELEAQKEVHEEKLSQIEEQYQAESEWIERRRKQELEALEAARDRTLKNLEETFDAFEAELYKTYGFINEETLDIGKRFADATNQTLDAGFQTVAQKAQSVIDGMLAQVRQAISQMEAAAARASEQATAARDTGRTIYNSADNRSASVVNNIHNGLTSGQVNAMMDRQVERILFGRR